MSQRRDGVGVESADRSAEYGRIPPAVFVRLWAAPDTVRFRYRPIRLVPTLVLVTLTGLWFYYGYTVVGGAGLTLPLVIFGVALVALSAWIGLRLLLWRLFVRRSGVALTRDVLAWRQGPACFLAPWSLIEPERLGLDRVAFEKGYDRFLTVQVGETVEPLYLVRLYARLDDIEGFMGELLKRIPREKWERAGRKAKKEQRRRR